MKEDNRERERERETEWSSFSQSMESEQSSQGSTGHHSNALKADPNAIRVALREPV